MILSLVTTPVQQNKVQKESLMQRLWLDCIYDNNPHFLVIPTVQMRSHALAKMHVLLKVIMLVHCAMQKTELDLVYIIVDYMQ